MAGSELLLDPPGTIPLDDQQRAAYRDLDRSLPAVLVPPRRPVTDRLAVVDRDKGPVTQQVGPAKAGMLPGDIVRTTPVRSSPGHRI